MNQPNNLFEFNKSLIKLSSTNVFNNLKSQLDIFLDYLEKQYTTDIDTIDSNLLSLLSDGYIHLSKIIAFCDIYVIKETNETKKYLFEKILQLKMSVKDYLDKFNGIKNKITEIKIKKITEQIKINKELEPEKNTLSENKESTENKESIEDKESTNCKESIENKESTENKENLLLQKELYKLNLQQFEDSTFEIINSYNNLINNYSFFVISYKEIIGKI